MTPRQWAIQVTEVFKKELPADYLKMWKEDKSYVFEFHKRVKPRYPSGMLTAKRAAEIENLSIDILNKYYTDLIREQL